MTEDKQRIEERNTIFVGGRPFNRSSQKLI